MSDNGAVMEGYVEEYMAYSSNGLYDVHISVKVDTDLDGTFTAFDHDAQEKVRINGWNWTFDRIGK